MKIITKKWNRFMIITILFFVAVLFSFKTTIQSTKKTLEAALSSTNDNNNNIDIVIATTNGLRQKQKQQQQQSSPAVTTIISIQPDEYLRMFRRNFDYDRRPVPPSFVHVPKSGGSTIEAVGTFHQIYWGLCMFDLKKPWCPSKALQASIERVGINSTRWYVQPQTFHHQPPQYFPINHANPYMNSVSFAIIRNPYHKLVSEVYWRCTMQGGKQGCTGRGKNRKYYQKEHFNTYIKEMIMSVRGSVFKSTTNTLANTTTTTNVGTIRPIVGPGQHFLPQYMYVVAMPLQVRMVDHVLQFETMSTEFDSLMRAFGFDIHLNDVEAQNVVSSSSTSLGNDNNNNNNNNKGGKGKQQQQQQQRQQSITSKTPRKLTEHDFNSTTLQLINDFYAQDFEYFRYNKI